MNLGKRLYLARKTRKMTQEKLSELTGASQASISALEKRDSETAVALFSFADALGVSPKWLLTGEEPSGLASPLRSKDELRDQLIDFYEALSADARHQLVAYANGLHSAEHPSASPASPFGARRPAQRSSKARA